jgi:hypothetical protein
VTFADDVSGIEETLMVGRFLRVRRLLARIRKLQRLRFSVHRAQRRKALEQVVLEMLPGRQETP